MRILNSASILARADCFPDTFQNISRYGPGSTGVTKNYNKKKNATIISSLWSVPAPSFKGIVTFSSVVSNIHGENIPRKEGERLLGAVNLCSFQGEH